MSDALFPVLEPFAEGWLEVDDLHRIRYEQCGNPEGAPALFLHGGPGSSINSNHRRFFDPAFYRVVLFDQRGCGQSLPRGETRANTTLDLVQDIERLRHVLRVDRWLLFGGSWGSTLALAYAQAHPEAVSGVVLRGVFLASLEEVAWFVTGLRQFLPEAWMAFTQAVPDRSAEGILRYYQEHVHSGDEAAALRWNAWENASMAVSEGPSASATADASSIFARVRIQLHYLVNGCFLSPGQLLAGVQRMSHLPGIVVQGRRDLVCPPVAAYTLSQSWTGADLCMVEEGGHAATSPSMAGALVHATQDMKQRL